MKRTHKYALSIALVISASANVFLFLQMEKWKEAWVEQFVTTSTVEQLLKASSPDLSYAKVESLLSGAMAVEASIESQAVGADKEALEYQGTTFLFKDGHYYGSKADLPGH